MKNDTQESLDIVEKYMSYEVCFSFFNLNIERRKEILAKELLIDEEKFKCLDYAFKIDKLEGLMKKIISSDISVYNNFTYNNIINMSLLINSGISKTDFNKYDTLYILLEISRKIVIHARLNDICIITYFDERYPENLKQIYDPPYIIYAKGRLDILNREQIGVIGARNASINTRLVTKEIVKKLKNKGYSIISGVAKGVDGVSHLEALKNNIDTIGVLGMGIDEKVFYPKENLKLFKAMQKYGLLISEYPYYVTCTKYTFPARNRIIAGICSSIIIVQATKKSGTLITAEFAYELGKDIYTTTGDIFDTNFLGNYDLIADGAKYIAKISDIDILF